MRHIEDPHGDLNAGCFRFAVGAVVAFAILLGVAACKYVPGTASSVVSEQKPGVATGAGATFTGPANSAAPSTQVAARRVGYYPPPTRQALPRYIAPSVPEIKVGEQPSVVSAQPEPEPAQTPQPAWIDEHVETTYGQHQDAAGIIKVANYLGTWGKMRWIGLLCLFAAYSGLLWSHGNADGYPVICWKVGACGLVFTVLDASLWWLLLLIIPAGFYLAQKLGLLRLPLP